jgi:hypothetical protein
MSIGGLDMRGKIALLALATTPALVPVRAYAAPPPAADLRMAYDHPQIAKDNSGVTWHWVLTNRGAGEAETVVATHQVSADQKIVGISQPCTGQTNDVVCRFDAIKPGEKRTGWIKTAVATTGGMLRVNAQVTWRENPSILPGIGDPSIVDASGPSGAESWGISSTDAMTEMPEVGDPATSPG